MGHMHYNNLNVCTFELHLAVNIFFGSYDNLTPLDIYALRSNPA
jgi:hypothetical protein